MSLVNLEVDRGLIDSKFEGYKLTLDPIPILKLAIDGGVEAFEPNTDEYSFMQMQMSYNFNHLFSDIWSPSCVFFLDQKKLLTWSCLMQDGRLASSRVVWQLPVDPVHPKNNASVIFPDSEWAVISDGNGTVYILHTPSRNVGEPWLLCHTYTISDCNSSCYLLYGVHMNLPGRHQIDCILAYFSSPIKEIEENKRETPPFSCLVEWLSFSCGQNTQDWCLKRCRRLAGNSSLLYVALESSCDAIYIASERKYKFIYDSEKPCCAEKTLEENGKTKEPPLYSYIQTPEDITVVFRLPDMAKKEFVSVKFESQHLEVLWKGEVALKGELENCIDCSASTWIICDERLEIILSKAEIGVMWQELVKGNNQGEELMDPAWMAEIHSRLSHLTSENEASAENVVPFNIGQLEDCDSCEDDVILSRLDGSNHKETHMANLAGRQWIFTSRCNPEALPIMCLRHDVDGILWQPKNNEGELDLFKVEHLSTFSAFGYVQASKQDKKFVTCSPDFKFAVISDWSSHVSIYCEPQNLDSELELRNRRTGQSISHIAKVYFVGLENCNKILGLQVSTDCIFVLSSKTLYAIKMSKK